jgi:alpha-mannosidase
MKEIEQEIHGGRKQSGSCDAVNTYLSRTLNPNPAPYTLGPRLLVHVVSHTHWDREWYHTAERFRQRLVPLIDELLDDSGDGSFLLDGQTVVLEDYLSIRPERASDLSAALRAGRIEAGPWFVLADELIPGGEGLVRNLLAGARTMRDLRAESPPVLYCPDSFGHPAALPDIAAGFGKALIVVWRGYKRPPDTFHWHGRHERVLAYHLPPSGYELGANLPANADKARARWAHISATLEPRSATGVALLLNGADHHARQAGVAHAVSELGWWAKPATVELSSLSGFARDLARRAASSRLGEWSGEMRDSYSYTWTLQGTLASRAAQKRRYARVERDLVRDTEPWAALARLGGAASQLHFSRAAWRDVLLCQPHDTLCGCSIDAVARACDARLESAEHQAAGIREDALLNLVGHDRSAARTARANTPVLVIRNPSPRRRSGVAMVELMTKLAHAPVGPGSGPPQVSSHAVALVPEGLAVQVLDEGMGHARIESPRAYPDNMLVLRQRALAWINDAPAYGVVGSALATAGGSGVPPDVVSVAARRISNGALALSWNKSGQLTLADATTRRTLRGLISWESREDVGDLYTPSLRKPGLAPRLVATRVTHKGPLRGCVQQRWVLGRGKERVELSVDVSLDAGARFVRIAVAGDNHASDHRLRLIVRCDANDGTVVADAAFGPVDRVPPAAMPEGAHGEKPLATAPLHRYVTRFNAHRGMTLYSDGLAEYEPVKQGLAVTLLRAVGELSRANLPERPGHAGWPVGTPDAQCHGPFAAAFALMFHGPCADDVMEEIERTADDVLNPITGETLLSAQQVPSPVDGVALEGTGLAFSAMKESETGDWIVLRCVNLLDRDATGRWRFGHAIREAKGSRMDEMPLEKLVVSGNAVSFRAPPRATVTVLVR